MGESARIRLVRGAQSDELREVFRQLAEIAGPEGPRFPRRVLMDLAARIVGRAYEPMLLELAHLSRAALLTGARPAEGWRSKHRAVAGIGFEWLFWGVEEARPGAFRAAFSRLAAHGSRPSLRASGERHTGDDALVVGDEAVTLVYPEGRFEVRYARMTNLVAMMELLVSILGYRTLVAALDPLAHLQKAPADAVKVLNRRELALLAIPVGENEAVRRLPRSWLRAECFGPVQNRPSQALRRRVGAAELAVMATAAPDTGYRSRIEALDPRGAIARRPTPARPAR